MLKNVKILLSDYLYTHLRQAHKKRRKKYGSKDKRGQICNRVSIDQRPEFVDEKSRIGDWEIDTVIGQNHKHIMSLSNEARW
jgi:IS30 family transposase